MKIDLLVSCGKPGAGRACARLGGVIVALLPTLAWADALTDLAGKSFLPTDANHSSYVTVFNELEAMDAAADQAWRDLPTRAAYDAYRRAMHEKMLVAMGDLPAKTPLNARTVATYRREGYRIEKVIFESMPGLLVPANLYIPTGIDGKLPTVVLSCGHSEDGKDCHVYRRACVLLARAGFVALMFDPYDQGERRETGKGVCCTGHNQIGARATLVGWSMAMLRVWDGMRAIDYVLSRPEVDANRIGYMGQSGGGTMSALMTAADWRLKATAPSCYLTGLTDLCEHMGPQDAEQNIYGQLAFGLNHTGYVLLPDIPVAITCKFSDMFTYYGTRRLFRTAEAVEKMLGEKGQYALNDAPGYHGWTETTETGSVEWMRAWLKGEKDCLPLDVTRYRTLDIGFDLQQVDLGLKDEECCCSKTGRTETLPGARSIFEILRERRDQLRAKAALPKDPAARASAIREIAHIAEPAGVICHDVATKPIPGYDVRRFVLLYRSGLAIPALRVRKAGAAKTAPAILSIGRTGLEPALTAVRSDLAAGKTVLVADLTGLGSIGEGRYIFYGAKDHPEEGTAMMLYLMGQTLIGRQATDLAALADVLKREGAASVSIVAAGDTAIAAAHAYAAFPGRFAAVTCLNAPATWSSELDAANDQVQSLRYATIVPGALKTYDWPELLPKQ